MKFLHISDVHLGCTRYQLEISPRDFFYAWLDVLQKYAIGENVDFVVMGGDFFHKRQVPPETMNHAVAGLSMLRDRNIPVITIEGNHDQKHSDSEYSWLRSLESWGLIRLLEPENEDGRMTYTEWSADRQSYTRGGYTDVGRARIFGSNWYGASSNWAIPRLTDAIRENRREGAFHILLLHTDVEGHQTHPIPALTLTNLKELKSVTEYVALGHTHKAYDIENWAFCPGSLEITSIDEYREKRGAWLVEVDDENNVTAKHLTDYRQRPFQRIAFEVNKCKDGAEVTKGVLKKVAEKVHSAAEYADGSDDPMYKPIVEITLRGHLGFPNSLLDLKTMRDETQKITDALHVRIKNHSVPVEYAVAADLEEDATREKLERRVIEDLIIRDNRFKGNVTDVSDAVIGAKRMALTDEEPEKIADFIALKAVAGRSER
jgi:DNA repair exonuclease SbcCD nuclease subunit